MSANPLHAQVADDLRDQILRGDLLPGTALPSEARLCERYDASRGTIRNALATLRHEGLIGGGQGRPPTVRDNTMRQPFEQLLSFTAWAQRAGRSPGQRTIELARRRADAMTAETLDIEEGAVVIEVLRLRTLDDEPVMVERSSFIEEVGRLLFDFDIDNGSIYAHLTANGVDLHSARHTIDAVAADDTDADLLDLRLGSPLLRERRRATDPMGRPIEYGDDRYRPDRISFTIDNARPATGIAADLRIIKETS